MNSVDTSIESFAAYGSLLEVQSGLHAELQAAAPGQADTLRADIALLDKDIAAMQADADLPESALQYGAFLVDAGSTIEQEVKKRRLRMAASFLLEYGIGDPSLMEDNRFYEMQAVLGALATVAADNSYGLETEPTEPVDYARALQNLSEHLLMLSPGESYRLSPAQVLSLAAPNMAFSRWQRYRLLRQARDYLTAQGYAFSHNNGRGRSSAYTVGRPALVPAMVLSIAA